ncbi:MAG TPA: peptidoglycan-binding domain-containing protein [Leifsonia sp.]|nr:peptidoglycan-binding domain-containing protein [Leifsonia sp.]
MRKGRRTALVTAGALIVAAVAGGVGWFATQSHSALAAPAVPVATAVVVSTTLSSTTQLSGTLGHGDGNPFFSPASGTVTGVPAAGSVVARGQALLEVDARPVTLFYGATPAWRELYAGVTPGEDVLELEQNLVALGFANGLGLIVDETFTDATATAVSRWQRSLGLPVTGTVDRGSVAFQPGPVRILAAQTTLGSSIGAGQQALRLGPNLTIVTAQVPVTQTYLVHPGDTVTITLPSGQAVGGVVATVSSDATASQEGSGQGGSNNGPADVPATITLDDPTQTGGLDQAPVTVNVTDKTVSNVLAVPITALVALSGGGYGVYVVAASTSVRTLVGVTPGLFATTLVQVSSPGLHAGDRVIVPAS